MNLLDRIFDFNKGVKLGKHLSEGEFTIGFYRNYINSSSSSSSFKAGFNTSRVFREHISYSTFNNLISENHRIYGNNPEVILIRSGPKHYISK